MLRKILLGLLEGGVIGAAVVAAVTRLQIQWTAFVVYPAVAVVGALVGALAGKPIWARDAKLEGMLKSLTGAFIATTALFGARKWLGGVHVNLDAVGGSSGSIGEVPAAALPVIGSLLGFVFQIDDALGSESKVTPQRVVAPSEPRADEADDSAFEDDASERRAARRE